MKNKKSSISGIDSNIIVLICYLGALLLSWVDEAKYLAWLLPLIVYIIERDSEFVKKHSAQATLLFAFYSFISIILTGLFVILFPNTNVFSVDLTNFAGSLLLFSTLSMISMLFLVVVSIFSIIAASKTWNYEDYNIPVIKKFISRFRKWMDKLMDSNKKEDDNSDVIIEEDSEIIMDVDIEENSDKKEDNKDIKKKNINKDKKKKEDENNE